MQHLPPPALARMAYLAAFRECNPKADTPSLLWEGGAFTVRFRIGGRVRFRRTIDQINAMTETLIGM